MKNRRLRPLLGLVFVPFFLGAPPERRALPLKNHSFLIDAADAVVCRDGAIFEGIPIEPSSLNLSMTPQVFDQVPGPVRGSGSPHTFTAVGETWSFTVTYAEGTFAVGDPIGLSVSDIPGDPDGDEGYFNNTRTVEDCSIQVPIPPWAWALLLVLVTFMGWRMAGKAPGTSVQRRRRRHFWVIIPALLAATSLAGAETADRLTGGTQQVLDFDFSKVFQPSTIGPGSTTELRFQIRNLSASPVENVSFTDVLPVGVVIASPSAAATDCTAGVLTAPAGGTTIGLAAARVGSGVTCTVSVNVTAALPGVYDNVSGELTSSGGSGGTAAATLTVDPLRPGFEKEFAPSVMTPGGISRLTFRVTNGDEAAKGLLEFVDDLPVGLLVASPSNASSTCGGVLTAVPGTGSLLFVGGVVSGLTSCEVAIDVTSDVPGDFANVSGELRHGSFPGLSSGFATAGLTVFEDFLTKAFTEDPVRPGGTVTLEFTIGNPSRDLPATEIAFADDLNAVLPGTGELTVAGALPTDPCGSGSVLAVAPGNVLTLTGGTLPPNGSCTFGVLLAVPASSPTGTFLNTTSSISFTISGIPESGTPAKDELRVVAFPLLSKEFLDPATLGPDPVVGAGSEVVVRFTITNSSSTVSASDIAFSDELTTFLPFPVMATLPNSGFCGPGATISLLVPFVDVHVLSVTGASLAPGASCSFDVRLDLPIGLPTNTYVNTTSEITATVGEEMVTGFPASDSFDVVAPPRLKKEFLDDPVQPGETVTLELRLDYDALAPGDAEEIAFTDDLAAVLPGASELTATGLPLNDVCGPGNGTLVGLAGDTQLAFSGATLTPGESCVFRVTLNVPVDAPAGRHTNETSNVVATVFGEPTTGSPARNVLTVGGLFLSKRFVDDEVTAGSVATAEFTLTNLSLSTATEIIFTDPLDPNVLDGLTVVTPLPLVDPCGPGSTLERFSGGSLVEGLVLRNGSLDPEGSVAGSGTCTFSVELMIPVSTSPGTYFNETGIGSARLEGQLFPISPARAELDIATSQLLLTKEFIDDPVPPGGLATLEFRIASLDELGGASDLAFTDDLEAALAGLEGVPPYDTGSCGGALTGTGLLDFSGGSLTGGKCSFRINVRVPAGVAAGSTAVNTTSPIMGSIGGVPVTGEPATDVLLIDRFEFSKEFDGPTVPGGTPILTFTIRNQSATRSATDLTFSDDLNAVVPGLAAIGLPVEPCGVGSSLTGDSLLLFSGGNLLPGGSCTFSVSLQLPDTASGGSFLNQTSALEILGALVASPATALLSIEPSPAFSKVFVPDVIPQGTTSRLIFQVANTASNVAATDLSFLDVLPFDLLVAAAPNVANSCGGSVSAPPLDTTISLSGGLVAAGTSCVVSIDVVGPTPRTAVNLSGDLTSSSGNSGPASAVLRVAECLAPEGVDFVGPGDGVFGPLTLEVCSMIFVNEHTTVFGPLGVLVLRAGSAVIFGNGVSVAPGGELTVVIDPSLLGLVPPL